MRADEPFERMQWIKRTEDAEARVEEHLETIRHLVSTWVSMVIRVERLRAVAQATANHLTIEVHPSIVAALDALEPGDLDE